MTGQSDHLLTAMSQSLRQHVMHISWIVITIWCCSIVMMSLTILFHFNVDYLTLKWRRSPFVVQLDSVSWSYIHLVLFCKLTFDWLLDGVLVFLVWWATTACDHHFNATLSIWERIAICCSLKFIKVHPFLRGYGSTLGLSFLNLFKWTVCWLAFLMMLFYYSLRTVIKLVHATWRRTTLRYCLLILIWLIRRLLRRQSDCLNVTREPTHLKIMTIRRVLDWRYCIL